MRAGAAGQRGVTLIEVMIALTVLGVLMTLAIPSFTGFLRNQKIKNAADTTLDGLNLARAEAIRRNALVRFQFVSSLTSSCAISTTSLNWIVSLSSPAGACDSAPGGTNVIQAKSANEGTDGVTVSANGGGAIVFSGLGRVSGTGITQIDFSFPGGGTCQHAGGEMRCMRVIVSTSGAPKMCDPKVTDTTDPRYCS